MGPHSATEAVSSDFIRDIVAADLLTGDFPEIHTRFPPEPNGYLHIGHAKSICLNFGIAREFRGRCNLRMDDTNPAKEEREYVESIIEDVNWLIRGWADNVLGLKATGQACVVQEINGKKDFFQKPLTALPNLPEAARPFPGGSVEAEPFYASDYFDQMFE